MLGAIAGDIIGSPYVRNDADGMNFEMFSGGTQYFIAAAPAKSGNIQAISITTVYDASTGLYTTVIEGFISSANIAIDNGVARLGFAWKTPGDVGNNGNAIHLTAGCGKGGNHNGGKRRRWRDCCVF